MGTFLTWVGIIAGIAVVVGYTPGLAREVWAEIRKAWAGEPLPDEWLPTDDPRRMGTFGD